MNEVVSGKTAVDVKTVSRGRVRAIYCWALLGHKAPKTTARYAQIVDDPAHVEVDKLTSEIARAINKS